MNYDAIIKKAITAKEMLRTQTRIYALIGSGRVSDEANTALRDEAVSMGVLLDNCEASIRRLICP